MTFTRKNKNSGHSSIKKKNDYNIQNLIIKTSLKISQPC